MTTAGQAVAALRAAYDVFAACDVGTMSRDELVAVMDEVETLTCRLPSQWHRMLATLQADNSPREMGAKSWNEVLRIRWRLSTAEAGRRLHEAADLGPRRSLTGEPLPALLPVVAVAQAAGLITPEHVKVIREAVRDLPGSASTADRETFEMALVREALG
ncbi:13E12 repeat family protein, partial [Mycolicibacterium bacteremicum]|uniref:13E12 repeat family protein n=1 Tax=Mycolicibacterium bacteremicum TaxID=564198 RepID=UPI0021F3C714